MSYSPVSRYEKYNAIIIKSTSILKLETVTKKNDTGPKIFQFSNNEKSTTSK